MNTLSEVRKARPSGTKLLRTRPKSGFRMPAIYFILPAVALLLFFSVYPMVELVRMSFTEVTFATLISGGDFVGFDKFEKMILSASFPAILGRTIIFGVIVLTIGLGGGLLAALALATQSKFLSFTFGLIVLAWALPPIVNAVAWRFMLINDGPVNELLMRSGLITEPIFWLIDGYLPLLSVAFTAGWVALPFGAVVIRAALMDVPLELLEAAELDGAGVVKRFWAVTFPHISGILAILSVLFSSWALRSFEFIFVMTGGGPGEASTTLPVYGYLRAFPLGDFSGAAAVGIFVTVLVLLIAVPYSRSLERPGK